MCEEIGLNWWTAIKLHERGWLSFNPQITTSLNPACDAELRFVGGLVVAGCDDAMLHHMLDELPKPYRYRTADIYFDWTVRQWRRLKAGAFPQSAPPHSGVVEGGPGDEDAIEAALELDIANASNEAQLRLDRLFASIESGWNPVVEMSGGRNAEIDDILVRASPEDPLLEQTPRHSIFAEAWPDGIDYVLLGDPGDDPNSAEMLVIAYLRHVDRHGTKFTLASDVSENDLEDMLVEEFVGYITRWRRRLLHVLAPSVGA